MVVAGLWILPCGWAAERSTGKKDLLVYVGTSTKTSKGIYAWRMTAATGELKPLGLVAETTNPTFLAVHPNRRFLYAVSEVGPSRDRRAAGSARSPSIPRPASSLS